MIMITEIYYWASSLFFDNTNYEWNAKREKLNNTEHILHTAIKLRFLNLCYI